MATVAGKKQLKVTLSEEVVRRVAEDSTARDLSINDVVIGILSDHFRVPFASSGSKSSGWRGSTDCNFPVPERLYRKVHAAAVSRSKRDVVESILREHYELAAAA